MLHGVAISWYDAPCTFAVAGASARTPAGAKQRLALSQRDAGGNRIASNCVWATERWPEVAYTAASGGLSDVKRQSALTLVCWAGTRTSGCYQTCCPRSECATIGRTLFANSYHSQGLAGAASVGFTPSETFLRRTPAADAPHSPSCGKLGMRPCSVWLYCCHAVAVLWPCCGRAAAVLRHSAPAPELTAHPHSTCKAQQRERNTKASTGRL